MPSSLVRGRFEFAAFTLDLVRGCLQTEDRQIELRPKSFDVLRYLLENAGRLVSRDELVEAVWPNVLVGDDALTHCISEVRIALGDADQRIIKTVPRRGYVFAIPVSTATPPVPAKTAPRLSIVVLPFANLSDDKEQEYFVDGVTESLTTDLCRMPGAFVIARNTAVTYKGKAVDVKELGRELGVRYVLEGSVQRAGNRLRVSVQLVDAQSGAHLWAERFDRDRGDLFEMQDEIVTRLARALDAELTAAEARRAEQSRSDPDAVDLTFRGWAAYNRGFDPDNLLQAKRFFCQALALAPRHVEALVGLALANHAFAGAYSTDDGVTYLAAAEVAGMRALELAPNHAKAHEALGRIYIHTNRAARGIAEVERAIALDRNLAPAYADIGVAKIMLGRAEDTEDYIVRCFRLSPRDTFAHIWCFHAGVAKLYLGREDEAVAWFRRAIEANRTYSLAHLGLAAALALQGQTAEAQAAAEAGRTLNPGFTIRRYRDGALSDNVTYLAQRERIAAVLRNVGVPEV